MSELQGTIYNKWENLDRKKTVYLSLQKFARDILDVV